MNDTAADLPQHDRDEAVESLTGLVSYLTGQLVDDADQAVVSAERRGHHVAVRLELPEERLGQAIGRGGRIARAMRTALTIAGSRREVRVSLDIEETDGQNSDA